MRIIALTAALAGLSTVSFADTPAPANMIPRVSKTCHTEILALCPKGTDHKAHHACVAANLDKISADCQAQIKTHEEAKRAARHSKPKVAVPISSGTPLPTS